MRNTKVLKLVQAALLAALCYVATVVIQVPSPMNGYVNLGDCFVLLSGWMLGPLWGFFAAGIGSMLADVLTGYAHYAVGTFLIKGVMALVAALLFAAVKRVTGHALPGRISVAVVSEVIMVVGYFFYAGLILGKGLAAAASIPGNIVQGVFGVVTATVVATLLSHTKLMRQAGPEGRTA